MLTKPEKIAWYEEAIARLKIFTDALETGHKKCTCSTSSWTNVIELLQEACDPQDGDYSSHF